MFLLMLKQALNALMSMLADGRACHGRAGSSILSSTDTEADSTPEHSKVVLPLLQSI